MLRPSAWFMISVAAAFPIARADVPAGYTLLQGTTWAASPHLAGQVVVDEVTPFSYWVDLLDRPDAYQITGNIESRVVKTNDGSYDFYWRLLGTSFWSMTVNGLGEARYLSTGYLTDPAAVPAALARFGAEVPHSFGVAFGDGTGLEPAIFSNYFINYPMDAFGSGFSGDSAWVYLDTDAKNFARTATVSTTIALRNNFPHGFSLATYGPAPIPEPATWALMLAGALGLVTRRRQRAPRSVE